MTLLLSCAKEEPIVACFTMEQDGAKVSFINCSENADEYFWEFGDGNNSIAQSPVHIYDNPGEYRATLKVNNSKGNSNTITHIIFVEQECTTCYVTVGSSTSSSVYCNTKQNVVIYQNAWGNPTSCWCH